MHNNPDNKNALRHKMKLEMLRYCQVWGYGEKQTIAYFKLRGVPLATTTFYDLQAEFNGDKERGVWYHEQALFAMEKTHKQSIEQLDELVKTAMNEIQQHQSTNVYTNKGTKEKPDMIFNENHDSSILSSLMKTHSDLVKARDDMLVATPVVQAIMSKHALDKAKLTEGLDATGKTKRKVKKKQS